MLEDRLQLRVTLGQCFLMLDVEPGTRGAQRCIHRLQLAAPLVKLDQHCDLAAQDLRHDGHRDVVDRAELVALQAIELADVHRGDEDDGRALHPRMLADQARDLEAVHLRHVHVEQDRREFLFEQPLQRLRPGERPDALDAEPVQDGFVGQQPGGLVVDEQDAGSGGRLRLADGRRGADGGGICFRRAHYDRGACRICR